MSKSAGREIVISTSCEEGAVLNAGQMAIHSKRYVHLIAGFCFEGHFQTLDVSLLFMAAV